MLENGQLPTHEEIAAAQDWWAGAGVDCDFTDAPVNWLAAEQAIASPKPSETRRAAASQPEPTPQVMLGGDPAAWPDTLAAFDRWWLSEASLSMGSNAPRPAPRGPENAELMILVPQPEADDRDTLLSGPQGDLIANMARAMGTSIEGVRLASVLPRHTPGADWARLAAAGLGALTLHHLALAAPRRLVVLGRSILPLLGADPEQAAALRTVAARNATIDTIAGREPATLLAMAPARRALWQRWLERSADA